MHTLKADEFTPTLRMLSETLAARISGDDTHLKIDGSHSGMDVAIRLDAGAVDSTLTIRMSAPPGFCLLAQPGSTVVPHGIFVVDDWSHSSKALYCDSEALANRLLLTPEVLSPLDKISEDPRFSLVLRNGSLSVSGRVQPDLLSAQFVIGLVSQMTLLVRGLEAMPEVMQCEADYIHGRRNRRKWLFLVGAAAILVVAGWMTHVAQRRHDPVTWVHPVAMEGWRPLQSPDVDSESLAFLGNHGQSVSSSLRADLAGDGTNSGQADILVRADKDSSDPARYLVLVQTFNGVSFNRSYPVIAFVLKVTNRDLTKMNWVGEKPIPLSNRDAILLVQQRSDIGSGELLLFDGKQVRVYRPEDFRRF